MENRRAIVVSLSEGLGHNKKDEFGGACLPSLGLCLSKLLKFMGLGGGGVRGLGLTTSDPTQKHQL